MSKGRSSAGQGAGKIISKKLFRQRSEHDHQIIRLSDDNPLVIIYKSHSNHRIIVSGRRAREEPQDLKWPLRGLRVCKEILRWDDVTLPSIFRLLFLLLNFLYHAWLVVTWGIFERRIVGEGPCSSWSVIKLFQNVSYHTLCTSWSHRVSLKGERRRRTFLPPNCPLLIGDLEMPRVVSLSLDLD